MDHGERAVLEQRGCLWPSMWRPLPGGLWVWPTCFLSPPHSYPCAGAWAGGQFNQGVYGLSPLGPPSFNGNLPRWGHGSLAGLGDLSKRSPAQPHPKGGP